MNEYKIQKIKKIKKFYYRKIEMVTKILSLQVKDRKKIFLM